MDTTNTLPTLCTLIAWRDFGCFYRSCRQPQPGNRWRRPQSFEPRTATAGQSQKPERHRRGNNAGRPRRLLVGACRSIRLGLAKIAFARDRRVGSHEEAEWERNRTTHPTPPTPCAKFPIHQHPGYLL